MENLGSKCHAVFIGFKFALNCVDTELVVHSLTTVLCGSKSIRPIRNYINELNIIVQELSYLHFKLTLVNVLVDPHFEPTLPSRIPY